MILTNLKALYLIYTEDECYFSPYVAYYSNNQYIVQKDTIRKKYTIESGEFIFRIDDHFDNLESIISEASKSNSVRFYDMTNAMGVYANFTIYAGGMICKSSTDNTRHASIILPFNVKRLKYGRADIKGDCVWITPCKPDGSTAPITQHVSGYSESCNKVIRYIRHNPGISTEELIWMMETPANRVTPRLTELLKAGRIDICETFINPSTGRKMSRWIAKD